MFELPRSRLIARLWWSPWALAIALPVMFFSPALPYVIISALLLAATLLGWSQRRREASLHGSLLAAVLCALAYLATADPATRPAAPALLLPLVASVPLAVVTALRPAVGATGLLATVLWTALADPGQLGSTASPLAVATVLGLSLAAFLREDSLVHAKLAEAALTEPVSGLGNFYGLKRDYARYQALADRQHGTLLLMRWYFGARDAASEPGRQATAAIARLLGDSVRQGDALYYLGDDEFVSLHLDLASGAQLAARVRQRHPSSQVTWAGAHAKPLVQVLQEVRDLTCSHLPNEAVHDAPLPN